ncbi:DNA translocase FtsK 4TM domain-containing protein [Pseudomonas putida]|uniref:DNA translocase FtsK n=1 Tax=Pseudomonas TaxID=286 RepID=UPI0018E3EA74|nr:MULTISPECIES: DNA translocase FtsK [Pseudomonas putida group]MDD2014553.1 DNA translocase FtsK 4TM domain-containing protein [Pseudomonas putida]MDD2075794.1 DNA translocase FtsK 4TM domain-containing protein [Pseudomonas putida]QRI87152.1 DNA translocase FtsK 4TM domain-containing protein [Pseudomonas putida]WRW05820.1 DNA translocase FtsK 4TM domain-containing protein [Pseudomonas putida]HDS1691274.1 DNA translocase FtsK 4TM domain-containing protein [Pseudomonas putida]
MKKSTATPAPLPVPLWRQQLHYRLKEGALIAVGALCLYLWMALLTYDTSDPGFSHTSNVDQVQNAAGRAGAYFADILFMVLGYFAYIFPLLLAVKTWQIFRERHQPWDWSGWLFSWRLIGLVFLVLSGAALAHIHFHPSAGLPFSAGGALGESLGDLARNLLNVQGSTLMFIALFLFGLTVFTDLSWFKVMDLTGKITLDLLELVQGAATRWWDARNERKRLEAQLREEEPVFKAAPMAAETREPAKPSLRERILKREEKLAQPVEPTLAREPIVPPRETAPEALTPRETVVPRQQHPAPTIVPPSAARAPEPSKRAMKEKQAPLFVDSAVEGTLPSISILDPAEQKKIEYSPESLAGVGQLLEIKLKEFGVEVTVDSIHPGPVITRYEIQPAAGVKVSRIANLAKDLARSLAVTSVRVVEVIPGKTTVGIEIPNENRQMVRFSEVLATSQYDEQKSPVTLALGHDIGGKPVITDLAKMPHLLVAGTTGSGKSVGVNAMILSILFKSSPEDARLIMIDPKMLELSIYEGIPHLLCPVVTDMKDAANALRWSVAEMERRYKLMAAMGVRNLAGFNRKIKDAQEAGEIIHDPLYRRESMDDEPPALKTLPTIVVVVDEFADMMMIVGKKVEELIARIAQKARAAGIHLILATQRPSVDVITGLIKANIPTRMAFQVSSKIDSRTIIDQGGAEQLLGHGDMLYMPPGTSLPIRVHGAFVSDDEVHRTVEAWKLRGAPDYNDDILNGVEEAGSGFDGGGGGGDGDDAETDALYDEAVQFVLESRRASISAVQRKLKIGYNRAARMIESMEMAGVVTPMNSNGSREVIAPGGPRD